MEYQDLPVYEGAKKTCTYCRRPFKEGEMVSVDKENDLVFCYSDGDGGCGIAYVFSSGKSLACDPMKFGNADLPDEERTPNHPHMSLESLRPSWLKRLLSGILSKK